METRNTHMYFTSICFSSFTLTGVPSRFLFSVTLRAEPYNLTAAARLTYSGNTCQKREKRDNI